ncbi:hypothetical protein Dtox_2079 [Desulfofarcimen acetoxidans DSM 771]|jgi:hypothetical protein|uniref:Uncharacterized protein n=1 Tax=Desulfofarcimen acetoxidans (strain ATCC 49208 / DSM 771 / KCTC 5769 / VKM B-1644 / 5575) TaxID=485916 RepID=C8VYZ8_DESAS|nr:hypothetical protein [Desulfofarcimen acetoxidans]ACV62908.1 hypothetical protein Dtox_2079 [Desulfofarcimen acetoxidans DSM 771]
MKQERGKVLEFKPRQDKKLKDVEYQDPAKRELHQKREREKKLKEKQSKIFRNIGLFILICFIFYLIKVTF